MMLKLILSAYTLSAFSVRKIEANANKYTFVWKKSIQNYDKKLTERSTDQYEALLQHEIIPAIKCESEEDLTQSRISHH
ncbi:transposase [Listeria fleischmannii FSL S10-1203]|uniref:Transposase n=1 Tax=Listeria fleischmannii FSL S10-1203 TaxID=1265822 RepID=W7DUK4_9LIST|nr:transposase [Listeria fleischmannii FSL S10-1203]